MQNYRYQNNLGHLNGYDFFNVSDYSDFSADDSNNYYSEHSGSHILETYCSNSKGGEIYNPITNEHISENSECLQYGDCEVLFGGCFNEQDIYISDHNNFECIEGTSFKTVPLILYSNNANLITETTCSDYSQVGEMINYTSDLLSAGSFITTRFIQAQIRSATDNYVPMNNSISTSILGKITYRPIPSMRISFMNSLNKYEGHWYSHFCKYSPDSRSANYNNNSFSVI